MPSKRGLVEVPEKNKARDCGKVDSNKVWYGKQELKHPHLEGSLLNSFIQPNKSKKKKELVEIHAQDSAVGIPKDSADRDPFDLYVMLFSMIRIIPPTVRDTLPNLNIPQEPQAMK